MTRPNNRRAQPGRLPADTILVWIGLGAVICTVAAVYVAVKAGHAIADLGPTPTNPFDVFFGVLSGTIAWPVTSTVVVIIAGVVIVALAALAGVAAVRRRRGESRVDHAARYLGRGRDIAPLTRKAATATAERLNVDSPGVVIAETVATGELLYGSWEDTHVDIWGPRSGKAVDASTNALTPHGWVPIKALARGCQVIGSDGRATVVTGVYPQGVRPAYRLTLNDGSSVLCDADHLWTVRPKIRQDKVRPEMWRQWTTAQLLANGLRRASGGAKYYLPVVEPVEFSGVLPDGVPYPTSPPDGKGLNRALRPDAGPVGVTRAARRAAPDGLPLDPYLLGVLLGDGGLRHGTPIVTTGDDGELLPLLEQVLPAGVRIVRASMTYSYRLTGSGGLNPVTAALRELGLWGHLSIEKWIPERYLLAGVDERRALLAGLLDTDGSIDAHGVIEYSSSSPQLAADVRFLIQALGGTATTTIRATTHQPSHRLHIRLPADAPAPFRLSRKRSRWTAFADCRRSKKPVRSIVSIEAAGDADMICISVAAPDGLFVVDDCIVTHNTTSRAVPAILDAPGAVYVTSNKRDVVDATRDVRTLLSGGRAWVFDPQGVALEEPTWWWNPLSYVTDEVKAAKLAEHFASGSRDPGARTDAFFDPTGQDLLAGMLLAAALDQRPITTVYSWLTRPADDTAVTILNDHHYPLTGDQVAGVIAAPEKQRGGVFGTAQQMAACLTNRAVARWVTPQGGAYDPRPQFDPHAFVRSVDTLYSLSMEGKGTAGPLVTALTVAVTEAAIDLATHSPGGRLPVPLLGVLDEAANVCRWRELPNLYSHFGSRGIVLMTILQSWSQGCEVWGEAGMRKLWSAANVKVYGGGVDEEAFLRHLSTVLGSYDQLTTSVSHGRGHRTVSQQLHRERILDVDELAALPKGRAIVLTSGNRPTLARTLPWMTGPYAPMVRRSVEAHDPGARSTLAAADDELTRVGADDESGPSMVLR